MANRQSGLVLILEQNIPSYILAPLLSGLRDSGLEHTSFLSNTTDEGRFLGGLMSAMGDEFTNARMLVAGTGVPMAYLVAAMPNLRTAVSIDPTLKESKLPIVYVDPNPLNLVSYRHVADQILGYLS